MIPVNVHVRMKRVLVCEDFGGYCCFYFSGWLEPLLDRIAREASTVVCPVIDVIDDSSLEFHYRDAGGVNVGGFDWNLQV